MKFPKRGTVESYFLIVIILAIAGFLIALYFLASTDYNTEAEVCKVSVLSRATAPKGMQNYVPLKCYTTKYCLTKDMFGKCEEFAGETRIERVVLPSSPEQAARKIEEINANAKYDCWEMMGQGKLDLVGDFADQIGLGEYKPVCVICSRIAIDKASFSDSCKKEKLKNEDDRQKCIKELNKTLFLVDINKYMEKHKVPNSALTYAQTFSNKAFAKLPAIDKTKDEIRVDKQKGENLNKIPNPAYINANFKSLDNSSFNLEKAYVFSQVIPVEWEYALSNLGELGGTIAFGATTTPILNKILFHPYVIVPGLVVAGATAGYAAYNAQAGVEAAATYCGTFESGSLGNNQKNGCSLIQSVPYNHKYVNSLCEAIEGNP